MFLKALQQVKIYLIFSLSWVFMFLTLIAGKREFKYD